MVRIGFRWLFVAVVITTVGSAFSQAWEKPLAPGVIYRMEVDLSVPRIVHAIRYSQGATGVSLKCELGGGVVYAENAYKGRGTVSEMRARTGAIAAINGDFFPFTGDPLGAMIRDGQLISDPGNKRAVFGWGEKGSSVGLMEFQGRVQIGDQTLTLKGINQECPLNEMVLNTDVAGFAMAKIPNVHAVIKMDSADWEPNGIYTGTFDSLFADSPRLPIQSGNAILTASGTKAELLKTLVPGQKVTITYESKGFDFSKVDQMMGGGPFLVRNGRVDIDAEQEHFDDSFINKRHPRTAMGRTRDGDIWVAVIDGRQKISDGATLEETAKVMQKLGCVDAINLDGGGSSTINLLGLTVNRPSDGKERPVANGVILVGTRPEPTPQKLSLKLPDQMVTGTANTLAVIDEAGQRVPNSEVLWSSSGDGWIDQGGLARPIQRGQVEVGAYVRGQLLRGSLTIVDPPPTSRLEKKVTVSRGKSGRSKKRGG
jgi:exopolysaccharide biosynthesis protein